MQPLLVLRPASQSSSQTAARLEDQAGYCS
jgi:hypothetical protein